MSRLVRYSFGTWEKQNLNDNYFFAVMMKNIYLLQIRKNSIFTRIQVNMGLIGMTRSIYSGIFRNLTLSILKITQLFFKFWKNQIYGFSIWRWLYFIISWSRNYCKFENYQGGANYYLIITAKQIKLFSNDQRKLHPYLLTL